MAATEPASLVSLSIGGILASSPLGVSVETIALGMGFAVVGALGRLAFDIQKALEAGDKLRMAQALGWIGGGMLGAPFITITWIVMLRAIGAQTDIATVIGLLFLGFSGPKGVTWLLGLMMDALRTRFPKGTPEPPKP